MRNRHDPWKWPSAWGLALLLVLGLFVCVPENWLHVPGGQGSSSPTKEPLSQWLILSPPPDILLSQPEKAESPPEEKAPPQVPDQSLWWSRAWQIRTEVSRGQDLTRANTVNTDSLDVLLWELGLARDIFEQVQPDSVLASRLLLMKREESWRFEELKPYWESVTRSQAYADVMSRAADMYDDFLQSEIMTPD